MTSCLKKYFLFFLFSFTNVMGNSQQPSARLKALTNTKNDLFGTQRNYIENIGQYGEKMPGFEYMGKIMYGYEGFGMPVLFTNKGLIHLQRKVSSLSREEMERREKSDPGKSAKDKKTIDAVITMEWVNADPNLVIVAEEENSSYYTYGLLTRKARAFKKLIYKNIYPNIDLEYSFLDAQNKPGMEYQLIINPGADISQVKMKYGGDVKKIAFDKDGNLAIKSFFEDIIQSSPLANYKDLDSEKVSIAVKVQNNIISFKNPSIFDGKRTFVIDPFISSTNLTGSNAGKAKDIDFDYAGNVYVSGGGDNSFQQLAKYDASGTLLWTFSGNLTTPAWIFGGSYGGWVVEKISGNIFLGQGLSGGFKVVRLTTAGIYDNYITTSNPNFAECWKMIYSCHSGSATILIAGGGGSANNELALLSPPNVNPSASNLSGLSGGHNDISDIVIDPLSDDMYTIYSTSVNTPGADCRIYKHRSPYTATTMAWSVLTGFFSLREPANRPYLQGLDNSSNTLAVNSSYLYYSDGKNLKAIDKSSGATVGTPVVYGTTLLTSGGIFADECNNVFVGTENGIIKVFKFDGSNFDDAAAADITITGAPNTPVYDLAYDNDKKLLYASGNGFVASFDVSTYCPSAIYSVAVATDCVSLTATATLTPTPPANTSLSYELYNGATLIASNTTGIFPGLTPGAYTVKVFLNKACGGTQTSGNFNITVTPTVTTHSPPTICLPNTADLTLPAVTAGSTPGLTYSYWTNAAATVQYPTPTAAPAGTYYIKGATISGCYSVTPVTIVSFPSPTADAGSDISICPGKNTQLHGSGGVSYQWTPPTYLDNPLIADPMVINPPNGTTTYRLHVIDANGCGSLIDDLVKVYVSNLTKAYLGKDTIVAINQPLQLNVQDVYNSGFVNWVWSPTYGLSDPFIKNPVAILDREITYIVTASTASNCVGSATINVKVYKGPEIYVPTAFTPGKKDGLNDVLKVIPAGIKEFHYFRIYNRWGQLVFSTTDPNKGWDGAINGKEENSNVFVWMAEGIDYLGNSVFRKGTCTLIR